MCTQSKQRQRNNYLFKTLIFVILNLVVYRSAIANESSAFMFYLENDSRNLGGPGSDQAYSNGLKFAYVFAEDKIPPSVQNFINSYKKMRNQMPNANTPQIANFSLSIGQQIYTPGKTDQTAPVLNDRPYAGWLYLGLAGSVTETENRASSLEVDIGVVGPSAKGKEVQNNFHDLIHDTRAEGWANTLHDEVCVQLNYQARHKKNVNEHVDVFPFYGAGLGQILVAGHVGGLIRFGYNLPDDYGPVRPSAEGGNSFVNPEMNSAKSQELSYYLFLSARENLVLRNIFLDGNTFQSSQSIKKKNLNYETELGFGVQKNAYSVVWRFVTRSPEFVENRHYNSFASIEFIIPN